MEIKGFWEKFTSNKPLFWGVIGGVAAVVVIAVVVILLAGGNNGAPITGCAVTVKTEGGMALEGIGVYVYADADKKEMVSYGKTDATGKAVITAEVPAGSVAVLEGVPAGYVVAANYPITQADTQIVLKGELLKEMAPITVGGMMFDFTVTDTDGTTHTLSELLKTNKAVVLNLWYTTCGPCQLEFPYLQQAYDQYGEGVALLALNCYKDDDETEVAAFKADNGLTLPMAKCDAQWETLIEGMAYPTTIVIDRYGMVSLIHVGSIDDASVFGGVFQHYTAEDYVQATVADINSLKLEVAPSGAGTEESPLEIGGVMEFEITVKPGEKVYCDLYKASGMILRIEDAAATLNYNGTELTPVDGVIETMVESEDTFSPIKLIFGSTASEEKTFKVTLAFLPGTLGNPIAMELGDLNVKVEEGNDQGVYHLYKADKSGKLTLECTKSTKDVKYGFTLYNLNTYKMLTYDENGELSEDGNPTMTIEVNAGDEVQVIVSTLPNEDNVYPAADLTFKASFEEGEVSTGGETGSQGGSQGGSTGGTQGGSTGGTQGGSQGGSTGGTQGGSQGGSTGGTLSGEYTDIYGGEIRAYHVSAGDTVFAPVSGAINYFLFEPTEAGQYSFTISDGKVIYYGNNLHFINAVESSGTGKNKSLTENIVKGSIGSQFLIGVESSASSATLTIKRVGNSIEEKPFTVYTGQSTPTSQYTYTGGSLKVVSITGATTQVVKGSDGYYHWGSASGPVIYVKLNDKTDSSGYLSFDEWLNSERPVIKTAVGSGSSEKRWDFTACMTAYNKYKDRSTGYYRLNDDLKFMLETLYEGQQWKDNIFANVSGLNEEMAWMFCCYYDQG